MSKWVQHISGVGAKWEVGIEGTMSWRIKLGQPVTPGSSPFYYFPKSEYVLCDPPEVWEDAMDEITSQDKSGDCCIAYRDLEQVLWSKTHYRLRKVLLWNVQPGTNILGESQAAFIIERKKL